MKKQLSVILMGLLFTVSVFSQTSWSVTGNGGTTTSNFAGTTDNNPFILKVNNQWAGFTGYPDKYNVSFGYLTLNPFNAGERNTALGAQALRSNTTGSGNIAIGTWVLDYNSTGSGNVAIGESAAAQQNGAVSNTVAIGRAALKVNRQNGNTAIGFESTASNTEGSALTTLGFKTLASNTTGNQNTAIGYNALIQNTTGTNNTALGAWTLINNTTGHNNTAAGMKTLYANTTGEYNTAIGLQALELNTTGNNNVGLGSGALNQNTTGSWNSAGGTSALWSNTTGHSNTAFGGEALAGNFDGNYNTAVGTRALWSTVNAPAAVHFGHGNSNTAVGFESLREITTGSSNVGIGRHALRVNSDGDDNTAVGTFALTSNTTGFSNVALGRSALYANTTGSNNIAIGDQAGGSNDTGSYNTVIGKNAYSDNPDGSYNTAIGYNAEIAPSQFTMSTPGKVTPMPIGGLSNSTAIGNGALANSNNQVKLGNSSVTSIGGAVPWTNFSDGRAKRNIREDVPGLAFINKLQPVTYTVDLNAADNLFGISQKISDEDSLSALSGDSLRASRQSRRVSQALQENKAERELQQRKLHTGFVAQDVEKAAQSIGFDFDGVDVDEAGVYGLRYSEFVMPLVKAVQELSQQNDAENAVIDSLQHRVDQLESLHEVTAVAALEHQVEELTGRINKLDGGGNSSFPDANGMFTPNASLEQNFPNPFKHSTTINYSLPQSYRSADIVVTDISGRIFKRQSLHSGPGASHIKINTGHLSAGVYYYSLYVDNTLVDSKKMIVVK